MTKNTGFRQVLRDRCPTVVSYALKWCKAKEKWLTHVYKNFIWIYSSKKERYLATKLMLGDKQNFDFHNTVAWSELAPEDLYFWKYVESWVNWFRKNHAYIENTYVTSRSAGKDIASCKYEMMKKYLIVFCPSKTDSEESKQEKTEYVNKLADFLIDTIEGRIH